MRSKPSSSGRFVDTHEWAILLLALQAFVWTGQSQDKINGRLTVIQWQQEIDLDHTNRLGKTENIYKNKILTGPFFFSDGSPSVPPVAAWLN